MRWEHCRDPVRCRQFPAVDERAYAAFQWQMAEEAFSGSKKAVHCGALNNFSSETDCLFVQSVRRSKDRKYYQTQRVYFCKVY